MSQDLQQNRYDQLIRRVGGLIGPGAKVSEVLGELFPVLDVENMPGELMFLAGWRLAYGSIAVTGAAGENPRAQIFNPVDSGKIMTVSSVVIGTTQTQSIRWTTNALPLTTGVGTERIRDTRAGTIQRPVGQIRRDSTVVITDATGQLRLPNGAIFVLKDPNDLAVLAPGAGFEVGGQTVASTISVTFYWRERVAEASELSF